MSLKKLKITIVLLFLLYASIPVFSQTGNIKNYTVNDGLASSTVYKIIQDKKGYMWFATAHGAQRFDGKNYDTFNTDNGLLDNTVLNIYEDSRGRIWFLGLSGELAFFDGKQVHNSANDSLLDQFHSTSYLTDFLEVGRDSFFVTTLSSNSIAFIHDNKVEYIPFSDNSPSVHSTAIGKLVDGSLVISTSRNFYAFDPQKKQFVKWNTEKTSKLTEPLVVTVLRGSSPGNRHKFIKNTSLAVTRKGEYVLILDLKNDLIKSKIWIGNAEVFQIEELKGNQLSISTNDGFFLYQFDTDWQHFNLNRHQFESKMVYSVYEDYDGNFWVSSNGNGIYYVSHNTAVKELKIAGLSEGAVNDFETDKNGNLWLGYNNGTFIILDTHARKIKYTRKFSRIFSFSDTEKGILTNDITGLLEFSAPNQFRPIIPLNARTSLPIDSVFVIGSSSTLYLSRGNGKHLTVIASPRHNAILRSGDGIIYFGTSSGLYGVRSEAFGVIDSYFSEKTDTLFQNSGLNILPGKINHFPERKRTYLFQQFHEVVKNYQTLFIKANITKLSEAPGRTVWVSTSGEGVFTVKNDTIKKRFTVNEGLSSNICSDILVENDTTVWIGSNKGLNRLRLMNDSVAVDILDVANGLPGNDVSAMEIIGDTLWVATTSGLGFFNLKNLPVISVAVPTYLSWLKVNNRYFPVSENISLDHNQNLIQFGFTGISFQNSDRVNYRYQLLGLSNIWQFTKSNTVQYDFLPPGNYTFILNARLGNGEWNASPDSVRFEIHAAYYQAWWFYLILLSGLLVIIIVVVRYRENQITIREKIKSELNRKIIESELKALRSQMNPHFMFNSLNGIQYFLANNEQDTAVRYLSKFAKLMRMILENSRQNTISLSEEIKALSLYLELEELRFDYRFTATVSVAPELNHHSVEIHPMIIQPFVENSIIHGVTPLTSGGKIQVSFTISNNDLIVVVDDNGIGRKEAERSRSNAAGNYQSVGMKVTMDRLEYLNQLYNTKSHVEIVDKTDPVTQESTGTKVIITFSDTAGEGK